MRRLLSPAPHIFGIQMMHIQVLSVVNNIFLAEHFLLILLIYWINQFLKLLNRLTVKRYFIYGSYKNYCYLRLRKTYIHTVRISGAFPFSDSTVQIQ